MPEGVVGASYEDLKSPVCVAGYHGVSANLDAAARSRQPGAQPLLGAVCHLV